MEASLLLLVLVPLFALGGRAQVILAQISDALADKDQKRRPIPLLAAGIVCGALSASAKAYAGF